MKGSIVKAETRTAQAVRLVLEKGYTQYRAAKEVGIDQAAVSRAMKKIRERSNSEAQ